jgi:hypothetical protein
MTKTKRRTKAAPSQPALPSEAFKPGPAATTPKAAAKKTPVTKPVAQAPKGRVSKKAAPETEAAEPTFNYPTAVALKEMGERFGTHIENIKALLADVLVIFDEGWPIANPEYDGNLVAQLTTLVAPSEFTPETTDTIEIDLSLGATLIDLQVIADDLNPGRDQGAWARHISGIPLEPPMPAGTPAKRKKTS